MFPFANAAGSNRSDADADVLAEYVLALLRHDAPIDEVRKLCEAEIPDFLKEGEWLGVLELILEFKSQKMSAWERKLI